MSQQMFKFINAQSTPQDLYVTEIVTLELQVLCGRDPSGTAKYCGLRMPYLRKRTKDGGLFWGPTSAGVQYHDKKNYINPRLSDSFFNEDIETFLNDRSWETRPNPTASPSAFTIPGVTQKQAPIQDDLPF
jgi:hypothetical protein